MEIQFRKETNLKPEAMKTDSIQSVFAKAKRCLLAGLLLISCTPLLHSQQLLKLKDGHQYMVNIVYQTKDTLKFQLISDTEVTQTLLMDQVDSIGKRVLTMNPAWDTTSNLMQNKTYMHFKRTKTVGVVLSATGAPLFAIGAVMAIAMPSNSESDTFTGLQNASRNAAIIAVSIGGGLLLVGIILAASSSAKMEKIQKKLNGFTFDLKYTREMGVVALVYRF
jgi:hypothetical protein